jgi:hypothetical protein
MLKQVSREVWDILVSKSEKSTNGTRITDDARRDACPLYHLIFYPTMCYDVYDQFGRVVIPQMPFIDRVLQTMLEVCQKRVGRDLLQDPLISRVFQETKRKEIAVETKQFFVILLLVLDNSCLEFFKCLFPTAKSPEEARFNRNYPRIVREVHAVLASTIGPFNILRARQHILENVVIPACF